MIFLFEYLQRRTTAIVTQILNQNINNEHKTNITKQSIKQTNYDNGTKTTNLVGAMTHERAHDVDCAKQQRVEQRAILSTAPRVDLDRRQQQHAAPSDPHRCAFDWRLRLMSDGFAINAHTHKITKTTTTIRNLSTWAPFNINSSMAANTLLFRLTPARHNSGPQLV